MEHPSDSLRFLSWLTSLGTLYWLLGVVPVATAAEKHQGQHSQDTPVATSGHGMKADSELPSSSSPAAAGGPEAEVQLSAPALSLEQLEQMALESNPTLAQAAAQVQAAAGRTLQAGLYPNPTVGYSGEEISTPASGGEHGGFVEQTIITAGKLGLSRSVFQYEQVQAEELAKAQRVRVLTTVRLLYYETLGAQNLVAWRDRLAALAHQEVQRVELDLRRRLSVTFAEYLTARQTVETYRTHLLANARTAYDLYLQRYQQMAAAYPQVLIAQRTLFQAQAAYVTALVDLWRAVVEIRGLLLVDGLAAPPGLAEGATGTPGVEVTSGEMPGMRQMEGQSHGGEREP